jgi:hypothetical protein
MLAYVPSLIQLLVVQFIGAFFVSVGVATYAARRGVIGCAADPEIAFGLTQIVVVALGAVMMTWALWRMFWPALVRHGVYSQLRLFMGNLHVTVPYREDGAIAFPSTHPAYAATEVAFYVFCIIPLFALGTRGEFIGCALQYQFVLWWTFVALLAALPLLRLIGWYVLRRRYPTPAENAYADRIARVVILPLAIAVPIALFLFGSVLLPPLWATRLDAERFAGGLAARANLDGTMVRVTGTLTGEPRTCACAPEKPRACYVADAVLDLGEGGIVVLRGLSDHAAKVLKLAETGDGATVSAYGKLTRAPKRAGTSVPCPDDPFAPAPAGRPRAYLELW